MPSNISSKENLSPFVYLEGFKDLHHFKNDFYINEIGRHFEETVSRHLGAFTMQTKRSTRIVFVGIFDMKLTLPTITDRQRIS